MRTYSLSYLTAPSASALQSVAVAAAAGYDHVGLRLAASAISGAGHDLVGNPAAVRETRASLEDTGIQVLDVEVIWIGPDFDGRASLPMLEVAAALQARHVLVVGDDPQWPRLAQSFARLCETVATFGLSVQLEFVPWTVVHDTASAVRLLDAAGWPANAGILVDALHWARSQGTVAAIAALPRDCLHYAQICDGPGHGSFTRDEMVRIAISGRALPGEGGIDLRGLFGALPRELTISIEIPDPARLARHGAQEWARMALAASKASLDGLDAH